MNTKGVGRPKEGNPEETRRAILRAAVDSFARAGFIGATTRNVAQQAGVNVATLHYHFGNKEGLYRAVWGEAFREKPSVNGQGLPRHERLASVITALLQHSVDRPWVSRLALQRLLSPVPLSEGLPEDPRVTALTEALSAEPGPDGIHSDPDDLARRLVALLDATVVSLSGPGGAEPIPAHAAEANEKNLPKEARRLLEAAAITLSQPGLSPSAGLQEGA